MKGRLWWCSFGLALVVASSGFAAEITVDETCTLADAIDAANLDETRGGCAAGAGRDEIHLTHDVFLSEARDGVRAGLPEIVSEIAVIGHGYRVERIKGAPELDLFSVSTDGFLSLYSIGLSRGGVDHNRIGGANGRSQVTLVNSTVSGSDSVVRAYSGYTLNSHLLERLITGGAPDYPARVRDSVISGLTAWGETHVSHSTFVGGTSFSMANDGQVGETNGASMILNSTFTESGRSNEAHRDLFTLAGSGATTTTVFRNNTIAWNDLGTSSWALADPRAPYYSANIELLNNIVAESGAGGDCWLSSQVDITNHGGNFDSDGSCGSAKTITELDAQAADHGGITETIALLDGSSAIGGGQSCADAVDQRGVPRDPIACDSGAFEVRELLVGLETTGICPGTISVTVSGATPGAEVIVGTAKNYRHTVLAGGGTCAGTAVGLDSPAVFVRGLAGADGRASFEQEVSLDACGDLLQAIDLQTCEISGAAAVGVPPDPPPCSRKAKCGRARLAAQDRTIPQPGIVDEYLVGDWLGTGCDSVAAREGNQILFDTDFYSGSELLQRYGNDTEDQYLVGDWNNDGCDDIAVRRGNEILMDTDFDGQHDLVAVFGPGLSADEYFVGDFDGSGTDAVGFRDGHLLHWDLSPWDGVEDGFVGFGGGSNEDQYLVGKWSDDPSSQQSFAVRRGNEFLMNYDLDGEHDFVQVFGVGDEDEYLVGDWDGDGRDNLAARRGGTFELDTDFDSEPDITMTFGEGAEE